MAFLVSGKISLQIAHVLKIESIIGRYHISIRLSHMLGTFDYIFNMYKIINILTFWTNDRLYYFNQITLFANLHTMCLLACPLVEGKMEFGHFGKFGEMLTCFQILFSMFFQGITIKSQTYFESRTAIPSLYISINVCHCILFLNQCALHMPFAFIHPNRECQGFVYNMGKSQFSVSIRLKYVTPLI